MIKHLSVAVAAIMTSNFMVQAQQQSIDLNPVSVVTTQMEQKTEETGRYISVIDGKLFHQLPVSSLDELLKYVPGVEIQNRGPLGAQGDIIIRGGTYQQTIILIDGLKINDPTTGHFNGYIPIAPAEIARIEVLRGPAAAVYGAEAVGGVINVITKTFASQLDTNKVSGYAKLTGGNYNLFSADAGLHVNTSKVQASVGVLSNNTSGYLLRGDNRAYVHNHTVSGSIAIPLQKQWVLGIRGSYDYRDFAAQNYYTTFGSDTATERVKSVWTQAQLKKMFEKGLLQIDIAYKNSDDHYLYNALSKANQNKGSLWTAQVIRTYRISSSINSSFGAQFSQRGIVSNDRGDHQTARGAAFGSIIHTYKKFNTSLSLRAEYDQQYHAAFLPQANFSYLFGKGLLRASIGRAIRSADFTERFNNYNKEAVASGTIGNPDLSTERSWNFELGGVWDLCKNIKVDAGVFYRAQTDMIDWVNTPYDQMPRKVNLSPTGNYSLAKNISEVQTRGFEGNIRYQQQLTAKQHLYAQLGVSLFKSSSSDTTPSYYIISHANVMLQGMAVYTVGKWQANLTAIYKDRNAQNSSALGIELSKNYFLANVSLRYTPHPKWAVFASCNNVLDTKYSDLLGSIMPGRWLSGGVHLKFN